MFESTASILQFYIQVLDLEMARNKIPQTHIRLGIEDMAQAYAPTSTDFKSNISDCKITDFSIPGYRCAYLHKYAPLHTYIVLDAMKHILQEQSSLFKNMLTSKQFKLCCLGGGPGSDAVGVLVALFNEFTSFQSSTTVIDCIADWKYTFDSVINHLRTAECSMQWRRFFKSCDFNYISADLLKLKNMTAAVSNAINAASLITMVKFVSAASCINTEPMVEKIFRMMRPGAFVLYIDNAAGGFTEIIEKASKKFNFQIRSRPCLRHKPYSIRDLKVDRFGYSSCFQTRVTIILMQKPDNSKRKKLIQTHSNNAASKASLRNLQNINKMSSPTNVTQAKIKNALLYNEAECTSQAVSFSQSNSASKSKASLSPCMQDVPKQRSKSKRRKKKSVFSSEEHLPSQLNSIPALKKKVPRTHDMQSIKKPSLQERENTNKLLFHNGTQCSSQTVSSDQNISVSKVNASLSSDVKSSKSKEKMKNSLIRTEIHHPSQFNISSQSICVPQSKASLPHGVQNIGQNFSKVKHAKENMKKSLLHDKTQRLSKLNCSNRTFYVLENNLFLSSNMQHSKNIHLQENQQNKITEKIDKLPLRNETYSPAVFGFSTHDISASEKKILPQTGTQTTKNITSQPRENINKLLINSAADLLSDLKCSYQNKTVPKVKASPSSTAQIIENLSSDTREGYNKSLTGDSSIISSTVINITNENLLPPPSNENSTEIRDSIRHHESVFLPETTNNLSPDSDIISRPLINSSSDQVSNSENTENFDSNCCSCCVIS